MGWFDRVSDAIASMRRADATFDPSLSDEGGGAGAGYRAQPLAAPMLSRDARRAAASCGAGHRVVYAPPELAMSPGYEVRSGDERDVSAEVDARLGTSDVIQRGMQLARQNGLAWGLMMDDASDPSIPLGEGPHDVRAFMALTDQEVVPQSWDIDPLSPWVGQFSLASVRLLRPHATISLGTVHRSRFVRFGGLPRDPTQSDPEDRPGADASAIEAYWPAIADYDQTGQAIAEVARMMAIPWLDSPDLREIIGAGNMGKYLSLLARVRRGMGVHGLTALAPGSKMGVLSPSLSGIGDVEASTYRRLTSVEGAPADWLLDLQVGGLGGDAAARMARLRSFGEHMRSTYAEPPMGYFYDVVLGPDEKRQIAWNPIDPPGPKEAAEIANINADAAGKRVAATITTPWDERDHLTGDDPWDLPPTADDTMGDDLDPIPGAEPVEPEPGGSEE